MNAGQILSDNWCIDSGATSHMCHEKEKFCDFTPLANQYVKVAANQTMEIRGKGTIRLTISDGSKEKKIRLEKVLYVPELSANLMSISKMTENDHEVRFKGDHVWVSNSSGETVIKASKQGALYF